MSLSLSPPLSRSSSSPLYLSASLVETKERRRKKERKSKGKRKHNFLPLLSILLSNQYYTRPFLKPVSFPFPFLLFLSIESKTNPSINNPTRYHSSIHPFIYTTPPSPLLFPPYFLFSIAISIQLKSPFSPFSASALQLSLLVTKELFNLSPPLSDPRDRERKV